MNELELKEICDIYRNSILQEPTQDSSYDYLLMMAKDIARLVQHECTSRAFNLANELANIHRE